MDNFQREDDYFSLCGLNSSLRPLYIRKSCSGCLQGSPCAVQCEFVPCSIEHGNLSYCFECGEYPCPKYDGVDQYDSLITHKNQLKDMQKAKAIGIEKYREEQIAKSRLLHELLNEYDNGRRDVFFFLAVNLFELNDSQQILDKANELTKDMNLDEKSDYIKSMFLHLAFKKNISLKLRKADGNSYITFFKMLNINFANIFLKILSFTFGEKS